MAVYRMWPLFLVCCSVSIYSYVEASIWINERSPAGDGSNRFFYRNKLTDLLSEFKGGAKGYLAKMANLGMIYKPTYNNVEQPNTNPIAPYYTSRDSGGRQASPTSFVKSYHARDNLEQHQQSQNKNDDMFYTQASTSYNKDIELEEKVFSMIEGVYIPDGRAFYGQFHTLNDCIEACKKSRSCFAGEFDASLYKCLLHTAHAACNRLKLNPKTVHFKKIPCSLKEIGIKSGIISPGSMLPYVHGNIQSVIHDLKWCIKACLASTVVANYEVWKLQKQRTCYALTYDFYHKKCVHFPSNVTSAIYFNATKNTTYGYLYDNATTYSTQGYLHDNDHLYVNMTINTTHGDLCYIPHEERVSKYLRPSYHSIYILMCEICKTHDDDQCESDLYSPGYHNSNVKYSQGHYNTKQGHSTHAYGESTLEGYHAKTRQSSFDYNPYTSDKEKSKGRFSSIGYGGYASRDQRSKVSGSSGGYNGYSSGKYHGYPSRGQESKVGGSPIGYREGYHSHTSHGSKAKPASAGYEGDENYPDEGHARERGDYPAGYETDRRYPEIYIDTSSEDEHELASLSSPRKVSSHRRNLGRQPTYRSRGHRGRYVYCRKCGRFTSGYNLNSND